MVTTHAHSAYVRRKMQSAWTNVPENISRFRQTILLRDENARRIGYANHADYRLGDRMINSIPDVRDMLQDIGESVQPLNEQLLAELRPPACVAKQSIWPKLCQELLIQRLNAFPNILKHISNIWYRVYHAVTQSIISMLA